MYVCASIFLSKSELIHSTEFENGKNRISIWLYSWSNIDYTDARLDNKSFCTNLNRLIFTQLFVDDAWWTNRIHTMSIPYIRTWFKYRENEIKLFVFSFLDVRPLESKINKNVTTNEYRFFMENMFYMNTKIAQYLRLIFETNVEVFDQTINNENSIQILSLLAHFPDETFDRSEHFWQMKINLSHFIVQILLQQTSGLNSLINRTIAENGAALLCKKTTIFSLFWTIEPKKKKIFISALLSLPLPKLINGSSSAAISIVLHLLSLSIAQSSFDQEREIWRKFFDQSSEANGAEIFDKLFVIYENRLNAEANDSLKLTVSNMIKSLLNISSTAKHRAIQSQ